MTDKPKDYFAGAAAEGYDGSVAPAFTPQVVNPAVERLAGLAAGSACLEFAIGTGRIALPLRRLGLAVDGIEYSQDMINFLKQKPDSEDLFVVQGDMATTVINKFYGLVYLVFNTIMNLTTQEAQVQCFRNVAQHLEVGGKFVIEVMVPELRKYPPGAAAVPFDVAAEHMGFDTYVTARQLLTSHHLRLRKDGTFHYEGIPFRYVWPAELDLMAQIAGMKLLTRHADWQQNPFDDDSKQHVSVWEKL